MDQECINDIKHSLDRLSFDKFEYDNRKSSRQLTPLMLLVMYYLVSYGHCRFRWLKRHKKYPKYLKILLTLGFVTIKSHEDESNSTDDITTCKTCYPTKLGKSYLKYALHKDCQPLKSVPSKIDNFVANLTIPNIIAITSIISMLTLVASVLFLDIALSIAIIWSAMTTLGILVSIICIGYHGNHDNVYNLSFRINNIVRDNKRGNIAEPRRMKDYFDYKKFLREVLCTGNISEESFIEFMCKNHMMISYTDQLNDLINFTMFADYKHPLELLGNNITINDIQNYSIIHKNQ